MIEAGISINLEQSQSSYRPGRDKSFVSLFSGRFSSSWSEGGCYSLCGGMSVPASLAFTLRDTTSRRRDVWQSFDDSGG